MPVFAGTAHRHTSLPASGLLQVRILTNAASMSVHTDRRTQSRKRPLSLVYVELPPSNGGMLRDLNEYGFSLRAMMPLRLLEKLAFSIALDNGVRIDGDAIVLRLEDKGHIAALEFAGLAAHSRDQIRRWLEKFDEPLTRETGTPKPPDAPSPTLEELRQEARRAIAGTPRAGEPVVPAPALEPTPSSPELQQPPLPEPPAPPPSAVVLPRSEIEAAPAPPSPSQETEVVAGPGLSQMRLPIEPVQEPPAPSFDPPPQSPIEAEELPLPQFLRQPENAPPPPPAPQLPQLLKLSSVRPGPLQEPAPEPVIPAVHSPVAEPTPAEQPPTPNPVPLSEVLIQPPSAVAPHSLPPHEPLSPWESESEAASPRWMESFTLGRAIGIMIFLALLVGTYVYHREVGHALIWLGQQIAGNEPQETSAIAPPVVSPSPPPPQDSVASASAPPASISPQQEVAPAENKPAPPSPVTSDAPPAEAHPAPEVATARSSSGSGQDEYQRAMQILKTPSRKAELPEAVNLLWLAVRKNHIGAEITLAELFHQGRGVAKSCDQTRILLSAAARKGSPDAKKRLQDFQREICRD